MGKWANGQMGKTRSAFFRAMVARAYQRRAARHEQRLDEHILGVAARVKLRVQMRRL